MGIADPAQTESRSVPVISIVTACYNSTPFIDRLYKSLQKQTNKNFEWVCVDDCSSDATVEHLQALRPPGRCGMQLYRLPQNSSASMAITLGVKRARGDLIIIMDHDDEFMPHGLAAVRDAWPLIKDSPDVCGLVFQAAHPDGTMIGRAIPLGRKFRASWMMNAYPDVHDATWAIKADDAKEVHNPETLEAVCTWGVVSNYLTASKWAIAGPGSPIRYYHRDNPNSQMNSWKLSRKWVSSYARYLDQADRYYFLRPMKWVRHTIALARYSRIVHGGYLFAARDIKRPSMRAFLTVAAVFAVMLDLLKPKTAAVVNIPLFPINELDGLENLHKG
jgi:glycosyltransferase involved in cell wall biosynthesis